MIQLRKVIRMGARTFLEFGEARDGYWTSAKFMRQIKSAVVIAVTTKSLGYKLFWVFDQSGCHMAFDDDSLNVHRMNAGPGGSVPVIDDMKKELATHSDFVNKNNRLQTWQRSRMFVYSQIPL